MFHPFYLFIPGEQFYKFTEKKFFTIPCRRYFHSLLPLSSLKLFFTWFLNAWNDISTIPFYDKTFDKSNNICECLLRNVLERKFSTCMRNKVATNDLTRIVIKICVIITFHCIVQPKKETVGFLTTQSYTLDFL